MQLIILFEEVLEALSLSSLLASSLLLKREERQVNFPDVLQIPKKEIEFWKATTAVLLLEEEMIERALLLLLLLPEEAEVEETTALTVVVELELELLLFVFAIKLLKSTTATTSLARYKTEASGETEAAETLLEPNNESVG